MMYRCCLCAPDTIREGRIPEGGGIPQCAECRAETYWALRQPKLPCVVTPAEQAYLNAVGLAMLAQVIAG
jgi:hypothetical protein